MSSDAASGLAVLGDFELRREIGRGGMGTVYEAWQRSLRRIVALKVLASHVSTSPKAVVRFRREAQAAAKLHHTHIVPIFAQGEMDGIHYYAMEFIAGESLNAIIARRRNTEVPDTIASDLADTVVLPRAEEASDDTPTGDVPRDGGADGSGCTRLSPASASTDEVDAPAEHYNTIAEHIASIADALDNAHSHGVIHRDVKPHNLILGNDGRMRIADFGLARLSEQPGVTITGEMIGSPLYMSPEQITGDPGQVDHRADIYSLGATMYEWLALVPPYPGETREQVISRILGSEPPPLRTLDPSIPVDLETINLKAIEHDRERRYKTAGEFRDDLRRFLASRPIVARRAGLVTRAIRQIGKHQVASLAVLAIAIAVSLGLAVRSSREKAAEERAAAKQASAAAVEAAAVADETEQRNELLLNWLGTLQGGPAGLAEAAIPMVGSLVSPGAAGTGGSAAGSGVVVPVVGTTSAITHRLAEQFYLAVKSPDWPGDATDPEDENAGLLSEIARRWAAGEVEEARGLLDTYLQENPNDFEAWQMHTILSQQLGRYDEMAKDAERLMESPEYQTRGYTWQGLAQLLQDRPARSMPYLNRAALLGRDPLWAKVLRGLAWTQAGRRPLAIGDFDYVLNDESLPRGSPILVLALLGRASALLASGSLDETGVDEAVLNDAVRCATEVLAIERDNADALAIRGDCHAALGDYAAAARDYQAAMNVVGQTPMLLARWGTTQMALHQRSLAEAEEREPQEERESRLDPPAMDPDEERSRGPFLDRFFRKAPSRRRGGGPGG